MSISYPLSLPSVKAPASIIIYAETVSSISISPITLKQQIHVYDGQQWKAEVKLPQMKGSDARAWQAFLSALKGVEGTFLMGDSSNTSPEGVATGTPQVRTAQNAGSDVLYTKGWTASTTGILKAGDMIQVGQRLHQVLQDVDSSASGWATLDIFPRLRDNVADSDTIITENAKGKFRLASRSQKISVANSDKIQTLSFKAVEAQ